MINDFFSFHPHNFTNLMVCNEGNMSLNTLSLIAQPRRMNETNENKFCIGWWTTMDWIWCSMYFITHYFSLYIVRCYNIASKAIIYHTETVIGFSIGKLCVIVKCVSQWIPIHACQCVFKYSYGSWCNNMFNVLNTKCCYIQHHW